MYLNNYKQTCRKLHITDRVIAHKVGYSRETVNLWLNGKPIPECHYRHVRPALERVIRAKAKKLETPQKEVTCKENFVRRLVTKYIRK